MNTGFSSSCKLFPEIYSMYAPGRTTGDDVGKNHKKTTVGECYVSVDIVEMDNV